jgi:hypothetical protein
MRISSDGLALATENRHMAIFKSAIAGTLKLYSDHQ